MTENLKAENLRLRIALEAVNDKLEFARMDDCEQGVRWLSVRASTQYLHDYRHTREALADVRDIIRTALAGERTDD